MTHLNNIVRTHSVSTKQNGNVPSVLVSLFQGRLIKSTAKQSVDLTMLKLKRSAKENCYGCDSLDWDEEKPLLDGWCYYYDKPVRVASTKNGFFHMQIEECLLGD